MGMGRAHVRVRDYSGAGCDGMRGGDGSSRICQLRPLRIPTRPYRSGSGVRAGGAIGAACRNNRRVSGCLVGHSSPVRHHCHARLVCGSRGKCTALCRLFTCLAVGAHGSPLTTEGEHAAQAAAAAELKRRRVSWLQRSKSPERAREFDTFHWDSKRQGHVLVSLPAWLGDLGTAQRFMMQAQQRRDGVE